MTIYLNNELVKLPNDFMTVKDLLDWKKIGTQGTAVAIDNHLIRKETWGARQLKDMDNITIISAAFGG